MGGIKHLTTNKLNSNYRVNSKMEVEFKGQEEDLTEEDQEVEDVQDNWEEEEEGSLAPGDHCLQFIMTMTILVTMTTITTR